MKVKQKLISLILSLTLAMGLATAPAFASSPDTSYFQNNSAYSWSGASGSHSLANGTKLGDLVAKGINYLSLDLASLMSGLNQIYTLVNTGLGTVSSNTTDIKNYLNTLNSGWWSDGSAPSGMTLSWYYQMLQAVKNGATDNSGIIYHLSNIYSSLRYWNGTDTVNIADLVADLGEYEEDIASNTAISASNLDQLLQVVKKTNGKFFEYYTRGNFPNGNFNDVTISTSETYGAYHANGDGSYQFGSLSGVSDRLEFLAWLHSDLLNVMGMMQTPNTIYKTEYVNSDETTTSSISLSLQDSIVLGNRVITDTLSKIYNERKDIDWVPAGTYLGTTENESGSTYISSNGNYDVLYSVLNLDSGFNIYHLRVPVTYRNIGDMTEQPYIKFFYLTGNNVRFDVPVQVISYNQQRSFTDLLVYIGEHGSTSQTIRIEYYNPSGHVYGYSNNSSTIVEALSYNSKDFYDVQNFVFNFNINKLFEQAKFMFFDDESIQAKKNNAAQTTAALDNFTGSGDASASATDFVGVKDSVTALKNSLSGGASYTQAFNILGSNSDGWSWFSQEVADSMDTTNSTRGLLRGNLPSSTPYLDSYYDSIYSVIGFGGDVE